MDPQHALKLKVLIKCVLDNENGSSNIFAICSKLLISQGEYFCLVAGCTSLPNPTKVIPTTPPMCLHCFNRVVDMKGKEFVAFNSLRMPEEHKLFETLRISKKRVHAPEEPVVPALSLPTEESELEEGEEQETTPKPTMVEELKLQGGFTEDLGELGDFFKSDPNSLPFGNADTMNFSPNIEEPIAAPPPPIPSPKKAAKPSFKRMKLKEQIL
jgi:hypothetical protein